MELLLSRMYLFESILNRLQDVIRVEGEDEGFINNIRFIYHEKLTEALETRNRKSVSKSRSSIERSGRKDLSAYVHNGRVRKWNTKKL